MTTIAYLLLKFKSMIKIPIVTNQTFFPIVTFSRIIFFAYINSIVIQHSLHIIFKKTFSSFVCLQFYKHSCLNILADNIFSHIQVKNQQK